MPAANGTLPWATRRHSSTRLKIDNPPRGPSMTLLLTAQHRHIFPQPTRDNHTVPSEPLFLASEDTHSSSSHRDTPARGPTKTPPCPSDTSLLAARKRRSSLRPARHTHPRSPPVTLFLATRQRRSSSRLYKRHSSSRSAIDISSPSIPSDSPLFAARQTHSTLRPNVESSSRSNIDTPP